jgi:hypothetical protein
MARGYPDFFGYSIFPWFGVNHSQEVLTALILSGVIADVFNLPYKGVIKGGFLEFSLGDGAGFVTLSLSVDGDTVFAFTLEYMRNKALVQSGSHLVFLKKYDPDALLFTVGFTPDISFGQEYILTAQPTGAANLAVAGELLYTRII